MAFPPCVDLLCAVHVFIFLRKPFVSQPLSRGLCYAMARRALDVVVYGASGFTGRLVAQYLASRAPTLRLGLAGRSLERLRATRDEVAAVTGNSEWRPALLSASADDDAALCRVAASTSVVLSTAGPFTLCGTPVVKACVEEGTDYVDVNGEVPWMRQLVDRFDGPASAKGVRIVPSCGYSVPSDLGTLFTVHALARRYGERARDVRGYMQFHGRLSGGTLATGLLLDAAPPDVQARRRDPFALGGMPSGGARPEDADAAAAAFDATVGCWTAPFWMAPITSRVVRRSHALFREAAGARNVGCGYGPAFGYRELALAKDESVARNLATPLPQPERRARLIAQGRLPSPGQGPSAEMRAKSWFRLFLVGHSDSGRAVLAEVSGGDPGYTETSKMVSEAALLLALRRDELPSLQRGAGATGPGGDGGVLTPAFALGLPLLRALHEGGIRFREHEETEPHRIAQYVQEALGCG